MATKCVLCESTKFGPGCPKSLNGLHKHNTDEKKCMYCGKSAYGNGCLQTPTRKHIHGSGGGKCKYCGKVVISNSMGCQHSPNRKHET
ncbi:MAG: hypothetical protein FWD22_07050 [Treponema sp.]|nr:hypothetical protein [Treponema sp.]